MPRTTTGKKVNSDFGIYFDCTRIGCGSPALVGQGLTYAADFLHMLAGSPEDLRNYYGAVTKLHQLVNARLDGVAPANQAALICAPGKEPALEINTMDAWMEVHRALKGPSAHVKFLDPASPDAKEMIQAAGATGQKPTGGSSLVSLQGYTGQNFYENLTAELGQAMGVELTRQVHASFAHDKPHPPSVIRIPLRPMLAHAKTVNAVLEKYLRIKLAFVGPRGFDQTHN